MPSQFLKDRYAEFSKEISVTDTVQYIPFSGTSVDALTGDVNESSAYSTGGVTLNARIEFQPSQATRNLAGREVDFDAMVRLSDDQLQVKLITEIKIGDAFILPDMPDKRYVVKVIPRKQVGKGFIERMVLVSRKVRSRG